MTSRLRALLMCVLGLASASPALLKAQSGERGLDVIHYTATIEPDIAAKTITGHVRIQFRIIADVGETFEFDRGDLSIDTVRERGGQLDFDQPARRVRVRLPAPVTLGQTREIEIDYHGAPGFGLQFVPERSQIYTIFSTSQWLVCIDAPDDKATLQLNIVLPAGLRAAGSGELISERPQSNGTVLYEWREDRPVPSYTFGFAAGKFAEVTAKQGAVGLRYLAEAFSPDDLHRVFRDTPEMIRFFEDHAGVPYGNATYTQVLVAKTVGQEASRFSVLSEAYGRALLDDPAVVSLSAHELAHQWWGNMLTCRDWTHFWLNEGFATFMAAAYDEHRFGRSAYLGDIDRSRDRYELVRLGGGDRSLIFPDWDHPTANDRTLVYHKGAYVLHLLRETLGERAFWDGIRHYTTTYLGQSVTTADFQRAMEQSSGKSLSEFFAKWVYLTEPR